jgi:putative PEP-CTERM system TPR-repeat lipoprotein
MLRTGAAAPEIAATLQRATLVNPSSSSARFALIAHYLRVKDPALALATAQEAAAALPNDLQILYALGRAQEAAGLANQAIETFNRLSALEPQSRFPLLQLAAVHARRADYDKVVNALQRAQRISANDPAMVRDLVAGYLLAGRPQDAIKQARALQTSAPKMPAGYLLEGDARAAAKQWVDAESAYRAGLKVAPNSGVLALRLHGALGASGQNAEAETFAKKWLTEHPKDTVLRVGLAEGALQAGNLRSAVAHYQAVVEQEPNNAVALNNLAWASGQMGDPKALGYAQRAVQIAPQNAAALDTLGSLLIAAGDAESGVEYLGRAKALAPDRSDIRLNYAKALIKAGKKDAARSELEALQAVPDAFAGKSEIASVLKGL